MNTAEVQFSCLALLKCLTWH